MGFERHHITKNQKIFGELTGKMCVINSEMYMYVKKMHSFVMKYEAYFI